MCITSRGWSVMVILIVFSSRAAYGFFSEVDTVNRSEDSTSSQPVSATCQAVYLELLGNNLGYSINYDRSLLGNTSLGFLTLRIGADVPRFLAIPVMLTYLSGSVHHFELGFGVIYMPGRYLPYSAALGGREKYFFSTATLGYRYQHFDAKGMVLRIGFTPIFEQSPFFWGSLPLMLSCGLSIGYGF